MSRLERILNTTYKVGYKGSWPLRMADKGIKLGIDAVVDATGADRFNLAKYAARGTSLALMASAPGYSLSEVSTAGFTAAVFATSAFISSFGIDKWRNYFSKPREALDEAYEVALSMSKIWRVGMLAFIPPAVMIGRGSEGFLGTITPVLGAAGLTGFSSMLYLMDGDHSLWDKAKSALQNVRQAIIKSPAADAGPAMGYDMAAAYSTIA